MQCLKQGIKCTFDDRNNDLIAVKKTKRNTLRSKTPQSNLQRIHTAPNQSQVQHRDSGIEVVDPSSKASDSKEIRSQPKTKSEPFYNNLKISKEAHQVKQPASTGMNGWGHEEAGLILASINNTSARQVQEAAPWDHWNVPLIITDPESGRRNTWKSQSVIEFLLQRYFSVPSFNTIVVPHHGIILSRLRHGHPSPLPSYLLHTIIACAAASNLTNEPEIQLWRSQVWHGATESVHHRLINTGPPELELVQSLLLLSSNWTGPLLRIERINTFDTAISLATSLQLHSARHLDTEPGPRSNRIILFWSLYCADKIMSVMTKRLPSILTESHSVPFPSLKDVELTSGLPPRTTIAAWLQRLTLAYISLCQITECVQRQVLLPIRLRQVVTLEQIHRRLLPIERSLESFCKEQRWLLGTVTKLSPLCRHFAESVISQLHFTQLHLYLPALQFEVDQRGNNPSLPLRFSQLNDKPLAATIESAWHLVQHAKSETTSSKNTETSSSSSSQAHKDHHNLTFSHACVLIGLNFFKFLSVNWADWDNGNGCVRYAPIRLSSAFLRDINQRGLRNDTTKSTDNIQGETLSTARSEHDYQQIRREARQSHHHIQANEALSNNAQQSILGRRGLSPLQIGHNYCETNANESRRKSIVNENKIGTDMDKSLAAPDTPAQLLFQDEQIEIRKESKTAD